MLLPAQNLDRLPRFHSKSKVEQAQKERPNHNAAAKITTKKYTRVTRSHHPNIEPALNHLSIHRASI